LNLVRVLDELGAIQPEADRRLLAKGLSLVMKSMGGIPVEEMEFRDFERLASEVFYRFPLRLPAKLSLYLRMSSVLDGTCREIDPEFDFLRNLVSLIEEKGLLREVYLDQLRDFWDNLMRRMQMSMLDSEKYVVKEKSDLAWIRIILVAASLLAYLITKDYILSIRDSDPRTLVHSILTFTAPSMGIERVKTPFSYLPSTVASLATFTGSLTSLLILLGL